MQIKNPERLFVTGRSRIVNIVDEESGQRTINEFKRLGGGDFPAFASGGSFQVGGTGGTDSQIVQFKASPWETVTVSGGTSGNSGSSAGADLLQGGPSTVTTSLNQPDPVKQITDAIGTSTDDITKQVLAGSDKIVSAINQLVTPNGTVQSSITGSGTTGIVNPTTGTPISSATFTNPTFGGGATGGAGGFNLSGSVQPGQDKINKLNAEEQRLNQQLEQRGAQGSGGSMFGGGFRPGRAHRWWRWQYDRTVSIAHAT